MSLEFFLISRFIFRERLHGLTQQPSEISEAESNFPLYLSSFVTFLAL
jgi:hypothetical protein